MGFDPEAPAFDLTAIREKLANTTGRTYWRSLEEVAETPEFRDFLEAEFPAAAESIATSLDRRQFLKLMGASLAMAGLAPAPSSLSKRSSLTPSSPKNWSPAIRYSSRPPTLWAVEPPRSWWKATWAAPPR